DSQRHVVAGMEPMRVIAVLGWLDDAPREALLSLLEPGLAHELQLMSEYPPETAGRLMDPRAAGFRPGTTVQQALTRLRAARTRRISDVFFTDDERRVTGTVSLQQLALAEPHALVETLVQPAVMVQAIDPQEEVVELFTKGRLASLPVVDFEG